MQSGESRFDRNSWTRLLSACVKFYKDVLLLENYAIMNYCGFSKILKKHDKLTGYTTREAYLKNVLSKKNFTHFPFVQKLLESVEQLFNDIQGIQNFALIQEEERLFIDAVRGLNYQAQKLQAEEISNLDLAADAAEESGDGSSSSVMEGCRYVSVEDRPMIPETNDLMINSRLFPRTISGTTSLGSSDKERDSSHSEEELKINKTAPITSPSRMSALDKAAVAVADAASRVHSLGASSDLQYTMSWMAATQSKSSTVEPVDKRMVSNIDTSAEGTKKRKAGALGVRSQGVL